MRRTRRSISMSYVLGVVFLSGALPFTAKPSPETLRTQAEKLLARAREASDLQTQGNPPFRFRGRVWLSGLQEGPLEGSYLWVWAAPGKWRVEIQAGHYEELTVCAQDKVWRRRILPYQPYRVYQLEQLLSLAARLKLAPQENVVEVGEREWHGARWDYLQTQEKNGGREFWFDRATGVLVREKYDSLEDMSAYEYADYAPVGGKLFPRSLRLVQFGKLVAEVEAEEVAAIPEPPPGLFNPPEKAESSPHCDSPEPPKSLTAPRPPYPRRAWRARTVGVARAYVVVGPDGLVHHSTVVRTPGEEFSAAVQKTLPRWRFRPATCHGMPVEFSMFLDFVFRTVSR